MTKIKYIIQSKDSTETHDVFRSNALNTEHNKYTVHTKRK